MEIYEAMSTQRAIRRLRSDPIPEGVVDRILTAATWAPSGGNVQPWRIILVEDAEKKAALEEMYKARWDAYAANYKDRLEALAGNDRATAERALAAGDYLATHMHDAPAIAIFCYNPGRMTITDAMLDHESVVGGGSVYPAVQNFMLACRAEGVGCVLTTLLCMDEPAVKSLLRIPADWHTCAHVPIGYAVGGGYGRIRRRPIERMVFRDGWSA